MMNSIDKPTSFDGGEQHRQLWTCLFQCRIQENAEESCYLCCGSFLYQHQKSLELQLSFILKRGVHVSMFTCFSHRIIPSRDFQRASKKCVTSNATSSHDKSHQLHIGFHRSYPFLNMQFVSSCKTK